MVSLSFQFHYLIICLSLGTSLAEKLKVSQTGYNIIHHHIHHPASSFYSHSILTGSDSNKINYISDNHFKQSSNSFFGSGSGSGGGGWVLMIFRFSCGSYSLEIDWLTYWQFWEKYAEWSAAMRQISEEKSCCCGFNTAPDWLWTSWKDFLCCCPNYSRKKTSGFCWLLLAWALKMRSWGS